MRSVQPWDSPARQRTVRDHNLGIVLRHVVKRPGISRAAIASATGLTKTTVTALVDELIAAELIAEQPTAKPVRGRPASPLVPNPHGPVGIGVEINVDYISACAVGIGGEVHAHDRVPIDNRTRSPRTTLGSAGKLARTLADRLPNRVAGAVVALPGLVDASGTLRRAPNLPDWDGLECTSIIATALDVATTADNEANLAALAHLWFADIEGDFLLVSGEVGIGAGLVLGGELFRGAAGAAGELGHVTVDPSGPRCACGSRGCLEQYAGQDALIRKTRTRAPIERVIGRAETSDRITLDALNEAGEALGTAIATTINLLDVPTVILGGLYARLGQWLRPPIETQLATHVVGSQWRPITVGTSPFGPEAAVRGAAGAALRPIFDAPGSA